jgi:hypothetical protein
MASSGKKRTTMAKLNRESKLRERRLDKQAKKHARKQAALQPDPPGDTLSAATGDSAEQDGGQTVPQAVVQSLTDA